MTDVVLEFRNVTLPAAPPYDVGLQDLSFVLRAGELAWVQLRQGETMTPLADVAEGLLAPEAGDVLFGGTSWAAMTPDGAAAGRGRIGRVFERHGWVSNLDVDENITLAQRYHVGRESADALAEAGRIAEALGLPGLPSGRPAAVTRQDLRRAEWVRALMGNPPLLLLERPGRELPPAWVERLLAEVNRRREQGLTVVYLVDPLEPRNDAILRPTLNFVTKDRNIVALS